jgi:hypothetical protein
LLLFCGDHALVDNRLSIWLGLSAVCFVIFTALVLIDWRRQKNHKK